MRISDWSSDVCSSDLRAEGILLQEQPVMDGAGAAADLEAAGQQPLPLDAAIDGGAHRVDHAVQESLGFLRRAPGPFVAQHQRGDAEAGALPQRQHFRSEEHTSELQSLMRISYAVFCLKKTQKKNNIIEQHIRLSNTKKR